MQTTASALAPRSSRSRARPIAGLDQVDRNTIPPHPVGADNPGIGPRIARYCPDYRHLRRRERHRPLCRPPSLRALVSRTYTYKGLTSPSDRGGWLAESGGGIWNEGRRPATVKACLFRSAKPSSFTGATPRATEPGWFLLAGAGASRPSRPTAAFTPRTRRPWTCSGTSWCRAGS